MLTNTVLPNTVIAIIWIGISAYAVFGGADLAPAPGISSGRPRERSPGAGIDRTGHRPGSGSEPRLADLCPRVSLDRLPGSVRFDRNDDVDPFDPGRARHHLPRLGVRFSEVGRPVGRQRFYGAAFAGASVLTPFFLGTVAGGVASGRVPLGNAAGDTIRSWLNPTSIFGGVMAVVATSYVAAVLITREADLDGDHLMTLYFRKRALNHRSPGRHPRRNRRFRFGQRRSWAFQRAYFGTRIVLLAISAIVGVVSLLLLARGHYFAARPTAALATVSVLWGWGAGQYPWVLEQQVTIEEAAASEPVLWALVIAFVGAAVLAIPALGWLYRLTQSRRLGEGEIRSDSTEALMHR